MRNDHGTTRGRWAVLFAAIALVLAACPADDDGADGADGAADGDGEAEGRIAQEIDLSGAELTVGSKEFTEQLILGHITIQALEAAGASVTDQTGLVGTSTVREALTTGEIDMYWEYTGTGWLTILQHTDAIPDQEEQYEAVKEEDAENDIAWLEPAGFNNTYAIAVSQDSAEEMDVETISDMARVAEENPDQATLCAAAEFLTRDDGLPGLEEHYGFDIPEDNIAEVELGIIYPRVAESDPCEFGEVFATDGRIEALDLVVLEDDENFFPSYLPAINVRQDVLEEWPQLEDLSAMLAEALDAGTMRQLNARVDVDGELPEDVAEDWLREEGFIE